MNTSKTIKVRHHKEGKGMSLKEFAHQLVAQKDEVAMTWLANKAGVLERKAKAERQKNKGGLIAAQKMATKSAKHKSKSSAKATPATIETRPMRAVK